MSREAQTKKPAQVAANDGGVPHTAWQSPAPQGISPVLRLIGRQQQQGGGPSELNKHQQQLGRRCL